MRFCLGKLNFIFMGISALIVLVGFVLMSGSASTPDHFNPEVFSDTRVVYGPNICFFGYLLMIVGICYPDKSARRKYVEEPKAEETVAEEA